MNEGILLNIRNSAIRAEVKEFGPTGLAIPLKLQAAISSVTPWPSSVFPVPEAQQSRRRRTSERAFSRAFWIPLHLTEE